jgi:predicted CoA-substrate-specific enzyme activase
LAQTGFKLGEVSARLLNETLAESGLERSDIGYVIATGFGRHQVEDKDAAVTDLTAAARGTAFFFPDTRTVLDIGGQTMKASRIDENCKVDSFRLNDKCAAGTGAFLEKTAHYMGFKTEDVGPLLTTSRESVSISGVCAVFAESEVINHLSQGTAPADIMQGAISSLIKRSVQLMKRVRAEPGYTLVGGLLRFRTMVDEVQDKLGQKVNVPEGDLVQFAAAMGAAVLGHRRMQQLGMGTGLTVGSGAA